MGWGQQASQGCFQPGPRPYSQAAQIGAENKHISGDAVQKLYLI